MKPVAPINIECIPEKEYLSPEFQLNPSSKSNGLFIYETSDPAVFTVNQDGIVTITGPGRAYVIIKQLESENFAVNQINRLIIVNKSKLPITFLGPSTILLKNTPLNVRTLKIQTLTELIKNVFSTDETILKILQISSNEYELVPVSIGSTSIVVSTRSNYYFNSTSAIFNIEVIETLEDQPLILNINTFGKEFQHNALKDIDILTSNNILDLKSNNLQISVQQQTRGYIYDIPILNLSADKFINDINNYNREILCCTQTGFKIDLSIAWDFGNNVVYDFFPYDGNLNDRPRINLFRSDGNFIDYASGGFNFLKIPPNSTPDDPNAFIYQKWENRNTGIKLFKLSNFEYESINPSETSNIYYGLDFFTTENLKPIYLNPPFENGWTSGLSNINEIKYQYILTGNYEKNIVIQLPFNGSSSSSSSSPIQDCFTYWPNIVSINTISPLRYVSGHTSNAIRRGGLGCGTLTVRSVLSEEPFSFDGGSGIGSNSIPFIVGELVTFNDFDVNVNGIYKVKAIDTNPGFITICPIDIYYHLVYIECVGNISSSSSSSSIISLNPPPNLIIV